MKPKKRQRKVPPHILQNLEHLADTTTSVAARLVALELRMAWTIEQIRLHAGFNKELVKHAHLTLSHAVEVAGAAQIARGWAMEHRKAARAAGGAK
jgi:hypothetical protein